jgi:hypothetical protein
MTGGSSSSTDFDGTVASTTSETEFESPSVGDDCGVWEGETAPLTSARSDPTASSVRQPDWLAQITIRKTAACRDAITDLSRFLREMHVDIEADSFPAAERANGPSNVAERPLERMRRARIMTGKPRRIEATSLESRPSEKKGPAEASLEPSPSGGEMNVAFTSK